MNSQEELFSISSNQNSSQLTITSKENQNFENYFLQVYSLDTSLSPLNKFFQIGLHQNKIEKITAAKSKTLFVTLSQGEARIWSSNNESDNSNFKLIESNEEEFYVDIAIHPFGFQIALAMFTGFRIFLILDDKLQLIKEVDLVWCSLIDYSSRARYLVTNEKNNICVFDTIHYNLIFVFKSHQRLLKKFIILQDQYTVISYCNNGDLMMWNLIDKPYVKGKVENEKKDVLVVHKHFYESYKNYVYNENLGYFIGTSEEFNLIVYTDQCKKLSMKYTDESLQFLCLQSDDQNGLLFCSTNQGTIRIFNQNIWNFDDQEDVQVYQKLLYQEVKLTANPLSNLLLIENNNKIITSEDNGTIMCFALDKKQEILNQKTTLNIRNNISEVIEESYFIQNFKIKEDKNTIKYLKSEIQRLKKVKQIEFDNLERDFKKVIDLIEKKYQDNLQENKKLHENFVVKCNQKFQEKENYFKKENKNQEDKIDQIQQNTKMFVDYESQKNEQLKKQNLIEKNKHEEELIKIEKEHKQKLQTMKQNMQSELELIESNYLKLQNRIQNYSKEFNEKINLEEKEYEKEIQKYTFLLEKELIKEKQETQKILAENEILQIENKKYCNKDLERQKQVEELVVENTKLLEKKIKLCLSLLKMQEQLVEKEQVIENKENTIKQSLEIQKSLENFRYILEDKIRNYQQEKDQYLDKIKNKENYLKELFQDLIEQSKLNNALYKNFQINYKLQNILKNELDLLDEKFEFAHLKIVNFMKSLFQMVKVSQNDFKLKISIKNAIEIFLQKEIPYLQNITTLQLKNQNKETKLNYDDCDELLKETNQLRQDIIKFQKKIINQRGSFKHKILQGVNKNKNLIEECNKLQEENVYYIKLLNELKNVFVEAQEKKLQFVKNKKFIENISYNNPYISKGKSFKEQKKTFMENLTNKQFYYQLLNINFQI